MTPSGMGGRREEGGRRREEGGGGGRGREGSALCTKHTVMIIIPLASYLRIISFVIYRALTLTKDNSHCGMASEGVREGGEGRR